LDFILYLLFKIVKKKEIPRDNADMSNEKDQARLKLMVLSYTVSKYIRYKNKDMRFNAYRLRLLKLSLALPSVRYYLEGFQEG
jgi:hypothetical protein